MPRCGDIISNVYDFPFPRHLRQRVINFPHTLATSVETELRPVFTVYNSYCIALPVVNTAHNFANTPL